MEDIYLMKFLLDCRIFWINVFRYLLVDMLLMYSLFVSIRGFVFRLMIMGVNLLMDILNWCCLFCVCFFRIKVCYWLLFSFGVGIRCGEFWCILLWNLMYNCLLINCIVMNCFLFLCVNSRILFFFLVLKLKVRCIFWEVWRGVRLVYMFLVMKVKGWKW